MNREVGTEMNREMDREVDKELWAVIPLVDREFSSILDPVF